MTFNDYKNVETKRLILKILDTSYTSEVLHFLESNKNAFELYESAKSQIFYTHKFQEHIIKSEYEAATRCQYLRYYVFLKENPNEIIGTVSFGNVLPNPYISCNIGYKIAPKYHNKGYGFEAILACINLAYSYLNIHRINAFVQEMNISSIRILEKCGFKLEGKCIKNLNVNGVWTDHLLYGLINPFYNE